MLIKDIKSNRMRIAQWGNSVEKRGWIIQPEGKRKKQGQGEERKKESVWMKSKVQHTCWENV